MSPGAGESVSMSRLTLRAPLSVSIKWSLLAAVVFLIAVLAGVSALSSYELRSLRGSVETVGRVRLAQVQSLGEIEEAALRIRLSAVRMATSLSPERREEAGDLLRRRLKDFSGLIDAHRKAVAGDAGAALLFEDFVAKWDGYLSVQQKLVAASGADAATLDPLVNVDSFNAFAGVSQAMAANVAFARLRAEEAVAETESASRRFSWWLLAANGVSALIGAATLLFVVREVSLPIRRMTQTMEAIARGALETPIPYADRGNELGLMARALAVFRKSLIENERLHEATRTLSELSEWLQSAKTEGELYAMVSSVLARLMPECEGALYACAASGARLEIATRWNGSVAPDGFEADACWSLRKGHAYKFGGAAVEFACPHCANETGEYGCIPILAHGKAVGLMHIRYAGKGGETLGERRARFAERMRLAMACAEHISAPMANARLREELRDQSHRDPLTGLANRRGLQSAAARLQGGAAGLVVLDIDHFKRFNDTHGHDAGDAVLRAVGAAMARVCEGAALACRFGGEEFVAMLPGAGLDEAAEFAERLRREIAALRVRHQGAELPRVTASFGVAAAPEHGEDLDATLKVADEALYAAKARGRDQVATPGRSAPARLNEAAA